MTRSTIRSAAAWSTGSDIGVGRTADESGPKLAQLGIDQVGDLPTTSGTPVRATSAEIGQMARRQAHEITSTSTTATTTPTEVESVPTASPLSGIHGLEHGLHDIGRGRPVALGLADDPVRDVRRKHADACMDRVRPRRRTPIGEPARHAVKDLDDGRERELTGGRGLLAEHNKPTVCLLLDDRGAVVCRHDLLLLAGLGVGGSVAAAPATQAEAALPGVADFGD